MVLSSYKAPSDTESDPFINLLLMHIQDPKLSSNLEYFADKYPDSYKKALAIAREQDDSGLCRG